MENPFIQQARRNINLLLTSKKYKEAYNLCNAILSRYPEEKDFIKLIKIIKKESEKTNEEMIEEKLQELDPLWDQEKYSEVLSGLKYLLKYAPNSKKLQKLYTKAQALYAKQVTDLKKQFTKDQTVKLTRLLEEDPNRLIQELYILERTNPGNQEVISLTKNFREKLVHKKIQEKTDLIYSDKYEVIENFIANLKKIDEKNAEIMKLEKLVKQRKVDGVMAEKKEFIYKGENYLSTLIRLKKYAEATKVAEELLSIDKDDSEVVKALEEAKNGYFKQTQQSSINMIEKDASKLKEEYRLNRKKFVKI